MGIGESSLARSSFRSQRLSSVHGRTTVGSWWVQSMKKVDCLGRSSLRAEKGSHYLRKAVVMMRTRKHDLADDREDDLANIGLSDKLLISTLLRTRSGTFLVFTECYSSIWVSCTNNDQNFGVPLKPGLLSFKIRSSRKIPMCYARHTLVGRGETWVSQGRCSRRDTMSLIQSRKTEVKCRVSLKITSQMLMDSSER